MDTQKWIFSVLTNKPHSDAWNEIFNLVKEISANAKNSEEIRRNILTGDRLISASAWDLWTNYTKTVSKASKKVINFVIEPSAQGKAILIIDAMSIRELPIIIKEAEARNITISYEILGSEIPADTDNFAKAIGVTSRSKLENNQAPQHSIWKENKFYTDVTGYPFEDCANGLPNEKNILLWHSWLDDFLHNVEDIKHFSNQADEKLSSDAFWLLIDKMRQGRNLLILSDHGYALSHYFGEIKNPDNAQKLKNIFGAKRYANYQDDYSINEFMPPMIHKENNHLAVIGQAKWKIQGGFPIICHGGMSLSEVSIPVIEISAK